MIPKDVLMDRICSHCLLQQLVDENLHSKSFYRLIVAKSFLCNQSKQNEMSKAYSMHSIAISQKKY